MEVFGIIGMSFGVFGLLAFIQVQHLSKEISEMKKELKESGALNDDADEAKKP